MGTTGSLGTRGPAGSAGGFTLVEAVLTVLIGGISSVFQSGLKSLEVESEQILLTSPLRSKMEELLSRPFDQITSDSEVETITGQNHTINWTVTVIDMDGDLIPEANAKLIAVSMAGLPGDTLRTIVVDHEGRVLKH